MSFLSLGNTQQRPVYNRPVYKPVQIQEEAKTQQPTERPEETTAVMAANNTPSSIFQGSSETAGCVACNFSAVA